MAQHPTPDLIATATLPAPVTAPRRPYLLQESMPSHASVVCLRQRFHHRACAPLPHCHAGTGAQIFSGPDKQQLKAARAEITRLRREVNTTFAAAAPQAPSLEKHGLTPSPLVRLCVWLRFRFMLFRENGWRARWTTRRAGWRTWRTSCGPLGRPSPQARGGVRRESTG